MTQGVRYLIESLTAMRERFDCAMVAATVISPAGELRTVSVYRGFATITDGADNVQVIDLAQLR